MENNQKLHLINPFEVFSPNTIANEQLGFQYLFYKFCFDKEK